MPFLWFHCHLTCFISIPWSDLKIPSILLSYFYVFFFFFFLSCFIRLFSSAVFIQFSHFLCFIRLNFLFLDGFDANFVQFSSGLLTFWYFWNALYFSYVFFNLIFHHFPLISRSFLCSFLTNFLFSDGFDGNFAHFSFGSLVFCHF